MRKSNVRITEIIPTTKSPTPTPTFTPFVASFEIVTNGTTRDFSDGRYHNLSTDVFIAGNNPEVIHVQKKGITWADFFNTLPMKVTDECLTTGTKQEFCTGRLGKLSFFVNDEENPDALDQIINEDDFLKIEYKRIRTSSSSATASPSAE